MARKGTTTFNGKTGVWRTVGGRRIFIATGESLEEAMRKSGKFGKSSTIGEPLPAMSTYLEKHGVNYADLDSDEVREYLKEYRRTGKIESLENSKDSKGPGKIQKEYGLKDVRNEMYVDQYKKGEMDTAEFRQKMLQGGESIETVDKAIAKSLSNDTDKKIAELEKKRDAETWNSPVARDAQKEIDKLKKQNVNKLESSKLAYEKAQAEYDKLSKQLDGMDYFSDEAKPLRDKRSAVYDEMASAKRQYLKDFNEEIPYDDMFFVAKKVSGMDYASANLEFEKPTINDSTKGGVYPQFKSNDIPSNQLGVFGGALKSARLENFNSELYIDQDGEPAYWGTMSIRYESIGGGSNGLSLLDYRYTKSKGWDITDMAGYKYMNGKKLNTLADYKKYFINQGYSDSSAAQMAKAYVDNRLHR